MSVPPGDETKHFKIIGTTGTGKSTAISELLAGALRRGDRAVIADPDGGYLRRFYDPDRGDVILNPFDQRSVKWDLFGEIQQPYDVEQLARSLIPDHEGADPVWSGYARTLFCAVTREAHACGIRDVGELYRLLLIAPMEELRLMTAGTPAQPFLEEHNERMFRSIRSVAGSAVDSLQHIAAQQGPAFSVRQWIQRGRSDSGPSAQRGVLFIPYRADQIAALRSTVSAWMRIGIFEAMAGPEADQHLWFVVDELDALGKIDGLKDALARLRKFGGRCVLGFQSIAQVASTHGASDAHTIVENCGNIMILRCSASDGGGTSRFASTLIGQREVLRSTASRTRRLGEFFGSVTRSEQIHLEPAVLGSEIEQLADLAGFLKFASQERWLRVHLRPPASRSRDDAKSGVITPGAAARSTTPAFVPAERIIVPRTSRVAAPVAPVTPVTPVAPAAAGMAAAPTPPASATEPTPPGPTAPVTPAAAAAAVRRSRRRAASTHGAEAPQPARAPRKRKATGREL
jgi:type IV secretory pathway TraG/TraD family ATPase VirD4